MSDGSVSGKQREIAGGGYVIATPPASQHNITNIDSIHTVIHESSIVFDKCSIAHAEMVSLSTALDKINELDIPNNSEVIAFCDNKQVVNIANNSSNINSNLYTENLKLQQTLFLLRQTKSVSVCWIPAHCNIKLHDLADELAVSAHSNTRDSLGQVAPQP